MALTTYQAAQRIRTYLAERYGLAGFPDLDIPAEPEINWPNVWTRERSRESGWSWAGDAVNVVWESSDAYDWPFKVGDAIYAGKLDLPGIHVEAATGYALSIYKD